MNTNNTNTTQSTNKPGNWMTELAEILFVIVAVFQLLLVMTDAVDRDFANFVYYNALPLIGILGYCGLKKNRATAQAACPDSCTGIAE